MTRIWLLLWIIDVFICGLVQQSAAECSAPSFSALPVAITVRTAEDVLGLTNLLLCPGSYNVTWIGHLTLESTIMVGPSTTLIIAGGETAILDGGDAIQLFNVTGPLTTLTLEKLTLAGGYSGNVGGAIAATNATAIEIAGCIFTQNTAGRKGGAIFMDGSCSLVSVNSYFSHNTAARGGAIRGEDSISSVTLLNTEFSENFALGAILLPEEIIENGEYTVTYKAHGGAISIGGELWAAACVFAGNAVIASPDEADRDKISLPLVYGGAVVSGTAHLEACNFTGNFLNASRVLDIGTINPLKGGAIFGIDTSTLTGCVFTDNYGLGADVMGGAVYANGDIVIEDSVFTGNVAYSLLSFGGAVLSFGGAVYASASAIINACNFTQCEAYNGGGVYLDSNGTVTGSNFWENTINSIYISTDSERPYTHVVQIDGCAFMDSSSNLWGAIAISSQVYASASTDPPKFSVFISNTRFVGGVSKMGAALYVSAAIGCNTDISVQNCTFIGNKGQLGGAVHLITSDMWRIDIDPLTYKEGDPSTTTAPPGSTGIGVSFFLNSSVFESNEGEILGGAVYVQDSGSCMNFTVTGCSFVNNTSLQWGGAVFILGVGTFLDTDFLSNTAATGGAIYGGLSPQNLEVRNCNFVNNSAIGQAGSSIVSDGGAIVWSETEIQEPDGTRVSYNTTIFSSTFTGNTAVRYGGAVKARNLHAYDSLFYANRGLKGGAIWASSLILDNTTFNGNAANSGGAAYTDLTFETGSTGARFLNNEADSAGGAVFLGSGPTSAVDLFTYTYGGGMVLSFDGNRAGCCYSASNHSTAATFLCENMDFQQDSRDKCCTAGQYVNQLDCADCTEGFDCVTPGLQLVDMPVTSGYWRAALESNVSRRCLHPSACVGGAAVASVDDYCALGYQGPYCAVCASGYAYGAGKSCHPCTQKYRAAALAVVVVVIVLAAIILLVLGAHVLEVDEASATVAERQGVVATTVSCLRSVPFGKFRVPIVVFQMLTQYVAVTGVRFPNVYESFLAVLSVLNLDMSWLLSTGCLLELDFYQRLVIATLGPLIVVGLLGCSFLCIRLRRSTTPAPVSSFSHFLVENDVREYHVKAAVGRHILAFMVFTFLIYSTVSTIVFQTFACDTLEDVGKSYLRAEYSIMCNTPKHRAYQIYAGFMVIIFPVGIPTLYAYIMYKQRRRISAYYAGISSGVGMGDNSSSMSNREGSGMQPSSIGFLWQSYKEEWYFFEIFECIRRLCLTGFMVFIMPGTPQQLAVACAFAVGSLVAYSLCSPHRSKSDGYAYILGCATVFLSTYLGLLLNVEVSDSNAHDGTGLSWLLITMNVALLLVAILQAAVIYRAARKQYRTRKTPARTTSAIGRSKSLNGRLVAQARAAITN